MGFFTNLLNPIFNPLLALGPVWALLILSLIISLAITLVYKYATNQQKMKELKDGMKAHQKQIKELKNEPEKAMAMQKEVMRKNMEYMKHSMKATLITFLPIIIIFGWMQANLAFEPIHAGEDFSVKMIFEDGVNGEVEIAKIPAEIKVIGEEKQEINGTEMKWRFKALEEGSYLINFKNEGKVVSKEVLVTETQKYAEPVEEFKGFGSIQIEYQKLKPLGKFSLWGWQPGWLALYITFSLITSILLRKVFKLH